jgi:2-polyprenyl-3-methyl-5-hydroxy-6-metoxy-1,4-benzoquinol methylase
MEREAMAQMSPPAFPETADIVTSSEEYARRFAGKTGEWMLKVQEALVAGFARESGGRSVLDVGGGHAQLAWPLRQAGFEVTVLGSAPECAVRLEPHVARGEIRFVVGNVVEMPFEDRSFDIVVSVRLLTHCKQWQKLVAEMCRVARLAVVVDYPALQGFNALSSAFFGAKKRLEGNTRSWRDFRHEEVDRAFAAAGYERRAGAGQFFWPMVLHRMLRCAALSRALEWPFHVIGIARRWGSPVIAWYALKKPAM